MSPDLCFRRNRCERFAPTRSHALVLGSAASFYLHLGPLLSHRLKLICYSFTWFHACKRIRAFVYMHLQGGSWALDVCVFGSNWLSAVFTPSSTCNHFHLFIPTEKPQVFCRFGVVHVSRILVQLTSLCMCLLFSQHIFLKLHIHWAHLPCTSHPFCTCCSLQLYAYLSAYLSRRVD